MFVLKKLFFYSLFIFISSCALNDIDKNRNINNYSIEFKTPNDQYNLYFKENLKRFFQINDNKRNYVLEARITFETTNTLSVRGKKVLKSTKAKINYKLTNKNTKVVKSGSINTFPALSSSSTSLYTQEKSIQYIKERLTRSSAKSLYTQIINIIRRLS